MFVAYFVTKIRFSVFPFFRFFSFSFFFFPIRQLSSLIWKERPSKTTSAGAQEWCV